MIELLPDEARVLGVLIEKALTTPEQYPLSLNAVVVGANQKSNRDPVIALDEDRALAAIDALRQKGLVIQIDTVGSRVHKYKHAAQEKLAARTAEVALLAELLLRGPQTLGELRTRASRMTPFDSLDAVRDMLRALADRPEPLIHSLPPAPGSRAERYAQQLCPTLHPLDAPDAPAIAPPTPQSSSSGLGERITQLEQQVQQLQQAVAKLAQALGEPSPFS
jgi:uncharacterized protein YceH (UPF0502 family)